MEVLRYPAENQVDGAGLEGKSTVQRPIPKPRLSKSPNRDDTVPSTLVATSNLIPSRSAPAPPNTGLSSLSKHGTLPKQHPSSLSSSYNQGHGGTLPKPRPRRMTQSVSSSRIDILESELAVSCSKIMYHGWHRHCDPPVHHGHHR